MPWHTGTRRYCFEMMNRGLVDIGLFLEPVNTEGLDYIRIQGSDHWIVGIKPDDPLAEKEYITKRGSDRSAFDPSGTADSPK